MEPRGAWAGTAPPDTPRALYEEDTPVDELPLETVYNECRSALMTVYLQTLLPGALLKMLRSQMPDGMKPKSLDEAVGTMSRAAPSYSQGAAAGPPSASAYLWRSQQLATELLAEAYYVRGQEQVKPHLEQLLKTSASTAPGTGASTTTSRTLEEFEAQLFPRGPGGGPPRRPLPLPLAHVARVAFGLPPVRVEKEEPGPGAFKAEEPPEPRTELEFNHDTLTTTVTVSALTRLGFEELRPVLDPQAWIESVFWRKAHRVAKDGITEIAPGKLEARGNEWEGLFYEAVEWNWNSVTLSEFRNLLRIQYSLNEKDPGDIDMRFHLYKSQGGRLPFLESASGVDVDNGYLKARPVGATVIPAGGALGASGEKEPVYCIETQKNVRFTDLLADQPVIADILGRGILNLLTPALLSLWMRELVAGIHVYEQHLVQQGTQLPAGMSSWPLPQ